MRGRTDPDPPPIIARGRNAIEAAGLSGSGQTHAARQARMSGQLHNKGRQTL